MKTLYESVDLMPYNRRFADATVLCADNILSYLQSTNVSLETVLHKNLVVIPPTKYTWVEFTPPSASGQSRVAFLVDTHSGVQEYAKLHVHSNYQDLFTDKKCIITVGAISQLINPISHDQIDLPSGWVLINRKGHVAKRGRNGYCILQSVSPYNETVFSSEWSKVMFAALLLTFSMLHNQQVTLEANLTYIKSIKKTVPILTPTVKENIRFTV